MRFARNTYSLKPPPFSKSWLRPCCPYVAVNLMVSMLLVLFHGSDGLSKCEETSQEEALLNQALRKEITDREDVVFV